MTIKIECTKEQTKRWEDFREAEKVKGNKFGAADTWVYYDVIRLRRMGYTQKEISIEANCGISTAYRILKKARTMGVNLNELHGKGRRYPKGGIHKCMS